MNILYKLRFIQAKKTLNVLVTFHLEVSTLCIVSQVYTEHENTVACTNNLSTLVSSKVKQLDILN